MKTYMKIMIIILILSNIETRKRKSKKVCADETTPIQHVIPQIK